MRILRRGVKFFNFAFNSVLNAFIEAVNFVVNVETSENDPAEDVMVNFYIKVFIDISFYIDKDLES